MDLEEMVGEGMVAIPGGQIVLRDEGTNRSWAVEVPVFQLATCAVTCELFRNVLGETPVEATGTRTPVTDVSWGDAIRFCNQLSRATGLRPCYSGGDDVDGQDVVCDWDADGYRLPSEAEWEHACRAGSSGVRYGELDQIAWYRTNSDGKVHEVATKKPNAWGLYDMIGNVWEWCWDVYDPDIYGPYRVFRGGGAHDRSWGCRASSRRKSHPTFHIDDLGFRLARSL
jgi:formylglycine-generating enzyme required for sulfatase activity